LRWPSCLLIKQKVLLAPQEVEIRRIMVQGQTQKKFWRPHLNQWLGAVVCICHPSYMRSTNRRIAVQADLCIKQHPISKLTNAKRTGRVV
jgi:hypothetical protein